MLFVLFAMLLMPLSAWADSYFGINIDTSDDGIWVTDANASNILGDGTMSYDVTKNILTLNGINLSFTSDYFSDAFIAMVDEDHPTLTVHLVGDNILTIGDKACVFNGWGITFTTDASNPGTLTINTGDNWGGALFIDNPTHEPMNPTYNNGLRLTENGNTYTIQGPVRYNLTVGDVEVTSDNASSITGTNITAGIVSYDATNNKLTLSGATINGIITYSGTEDLTIAFSGTENAVSTSENYAIQYVGSDSELPNLAFSLTNGSTIGSLNLSSENCVISGFSDVDFGNLNLASASAQGVYYDSSEIGYHMAGYGGNPNDLTITTDTYYPIWIYDPSLSNTGYPYTQLRGESTIIINDNSENPGTVSFNGDYTITISNVDFNYEGNTLIVVGPGMEELTVNLVGTSTVRSGSIFLSLWATTPLTFTTDESNPGSLTAPTIVSWNNFENGQITYQNGLKVFYDVENSYKKTISTTGTYFKIGNTEVSATGDITTSGATAHFDASSNTLTLTNATIGVQGAAASTDIQVLVDNLIIEISGTNTLYGNISYNGSNYQSSNIQINKASNVESASLKVTNVEGFTSCTWGDGLYLSAQDAQGATVDVHYEHYEGEGGSMESYYGNNIAEVFFSTTETNAIWVAGNMSTGGNITGEDIEGTVTYNANDRILTIENASISTSENNPSPLIVCNGDLTVNLVGEDNQVYFNGYYGTYVFKNNGATGILTFTGEGTLHINSDYKEGTYFGLCDGFSTVDFGDLAYTINGDSKKISPLDISTPMMNVHEGKIAFITEGYLFGSTTYYKIIYADGSGNEEEVPLTNVVSNQTFDFNNYNEKITISELTGPCTVYAYTKYKEETGASAKAKLFGPAEDPMRLVYEAEPVDFVLAPALEEDDGIKINGIESNVTYNSTTGKVSSETMGSHGAVVTLGYQDETIQTTLLNNYFNMSFDVVPPAPTIGLAEGTYSSTQDNITITSDGLANTTIKYKWDDDDEADYPATGVPFQAGTLKAWVVYTSGETPVSSDIVSATYTLLQDPGLDFVVGDNPVEEDVNYTIGGSSNPTLPTLQKPEGVTVTYASSNTGVATVATDGTVTPVGVGYTTITATSTATSEYEAGEASYTLNVYKDLSHSSITVEVANVTYNGQAKTPTVTVKDGDKVLMYGEDNGGGTLLYEYKVEYANNTNAGLATAETGAPTVTVTAYTDDDYSESHMEVTHYRGSTTKTFTISPMSISTATVSVDATQTYTYTGSEIKPSVSVSIYLTENAENITTLTEGTDYTVTGYANNTNAATATSENAPTITITGKGNFTGTATGTFTIDQANLGDVTIAPIADQTYTGSQITPTDITVTFNGNAVAEDEYSISYGSNTNVGEGTVTLTSKDKNFSTTSTKGATFTIVAKALTDAMVADIAAQTYSGTELKPALTVKDGETTLEEDTHYEVTYSNNKNAGTTAKATITGKGNYSGSIDKFFTINKAQLTVTADDKTYNVGDDITLTVTITGFVNGETKTVLTTQPSASYGTADVTKPGSYTITVNGGEAANYDFDYKTGTLTINRLLDVSFSASNEWVTYYASENLATPEGLQAYIVTGVGESEVATTQIDYIPANTAVLLQNVSNNNTWSNIAASANTEATSTFASNKLIGTAEDVSVSSITGGTVYVLINNMFRRATGTIPARRGYLVVNSSNAPQLSITIDDETTVIGRVGCDSVATDGDEWFTLDGRKLQQKPTKDGLYIKNGKKVVINKK